MKKNGTNQVDVDVVNEFEAPMDSNKPLGSCDELLSAKIFNLDGTVKKQHMHLISKTFVFF